MNRTVCIFVLIVTCVLSCDMQAMLQRGTTATMKNLNIKPNIITRSLGKTEVPTYCPAPALQNISNAMRTVKTESQEGGRFESKYEGGRGWEEKASHGSEFFEHNRSGAQKSALRAGAGAAFFSGLFTVKESQEEKKQVHEELQDLKDLALYYGDLINSTTPPIERAVYAAAYDFAVGNIYEAGKQLEILSVLVSEEDQPESLASKVSAHLKHLFVNSGARTAINAMNRVDLVGLTLRAMCLKILNTNNSEEITHLQRSLANIVPLYAQLSAVASGAELNGLTILKQSPAAKSALNNFAKTPSWDSYVNIKKFVPLKFDAYNLD
ncbi:MAG: hypothetical protein WCE21_03330 [Candidatus Babeliales bacterium]